MIQKLLLPTLLFFLIQSLCAQNVFNSTAEHNADFKVFVVDREYKADLLVFKVDRAYKAKDNVGLWYFTDAEYKADISLFFVDRDYKSDLKIFYVDREYKAGWRNENKKSELNIPTRE
ncbi:DUF6150 family protein [Flagellimonas iocasae]|uniref:DUF6150 family protein n=1 Tax=Flagellimonas iocasae TaxID=2055905 RepID=A0ABW4XX07_9FLAO